MKPKKAKRKAAPKGKRGRQFTGNKVFSISIHPIIAMAYQTAFNCGLSSAITHAAKYLPAPPPITLAARSVRVGRLKRLNDAFAAATNPETEADADDT